VNLMGSKRVILNRLFPLPPHAVLVSQIPDSVARLWQNNGPVAVGLLFVAVLLALSNRLQTDIIR